MNLVLDASMALSWLFVRVNKNESDRSELALSTLAEAMVIVPVLWHLEITNALLVGERRKIVTEAQVIDYLGRLTKLPIITDDVSLSNRRDNIMSLAREHMLTSYDATYLDLALHKNAVLATFDTQLAAAMRNAGGAVFGDV